MTSYLQNENEKSYQIKFSIRNAFMAIMTHVKFHFNRLMLTLIFGIRASEPPPPPPPGERLKRPGLIGLKAIIVGRENQNSSKLSIG